MAQTNNSVETIISQIPESVKQNSNIDELLKKLEKSKGKERLEIINAINDELNKLLEWNIDFKLSEEDKEKLKEIQEQIEQ